jgi:hypothetical protein
MRTVPVNQSALPFVDGCEPTRVMCMAPLRLVWWCALGRVSFGPGRVAMPRRVVHGAVPGARPVPRHAVDVCFDLRAARDRSPGLRRGR